MRLTVCIASRVHSGSGGLNEALKPPVGMYGAYYEVRRVHDPQNTPITIEIEIGC
jgi:hypothetical protein